jgi:hypothetical protein
MNFKGFMYYFINYYILEIKKASPRQSQPLLTYEKHRVKSR